MRRILDLSGPKLSEKSCVVFHKRIDLGMPVNWMSQYDVCHLQAKNHSQMGCLMDKVAFIAAAASVKNRAAHNFLKLLLVTTNSLR